uniref:AB hydrolase-1 domain-containing protein n=1 Tax=Tetraselmis chuii TaxID=63592 RepID=A0A7S1SUR5_9CHLO|mmetsp:Transcript_3054/g.5551  ORF Transcript_3054/g.5551 Transcript_3054/m.5551 type:complete len:388 (+) Transcript_3054:226-1389(+)
MAAPTVSSGAAIASGSGSTTQNVALPLISWWRRYTRWTQTSREEAVHAEQNLLAVRSGSTPVETVDVSLSCGNKIHTLVAGKPSGTAPLVCIPGYGAGAGFFWKNIGPLADGGQRVLTLDLLGTGLSSRPAFNAKDTAAAEDFFVGSLSDWREKMGLDKMILVAHSMGGYLATVYALRHPEHVQHLVLVSPAGIPAMPSDWEPKAVRSSFSVAGVAWRTAISAWEGGVTPGAITRGLGPFGMGLVNRYISGRFRRTGEGLTDDEVSSFRDYQYHILAQNGSGEHALRHILQPFAWARQPLEHRISDLKVPVTFVYGDKDWMLSIDQEAPARCIQALNSTKAAVHPPKPDSPDRKIFTIPDAGHYLFIDQPALFHDIIQRVVSMHSPA